MHHSIPWSIVYFDAKITMEHFLQGICIVQRILHSFEICSKLTGSLRNTVKLLPNSSYSTPDVLNPGSIHFWLILPILLSLYRFIYLRQNRFWSITSSRSHAESSQQNESGQFPRRRRTAIIHFLNSVTVCEFYSSLFRASNLGLESVTLRVHFNYQMSFHSYLK